MPHDHAKGHHHHVDPDSGDRAVAAAVGVNVALTVAEIVGGILSGSVALIADAVHNLSDAVSLAIAWAARRIGRRPTDETMTFGYKRAELVAALINLTTLIIIGLYLVYEAIQRFFAPVEIIGWLMIWVSVFALVVDAVTAWLTYRLSKESVNIRAAFLHNVADALGSVAVIITGVLIVQFGWSWADPLATLLIAGYILWMAVGEIRGVINTLMLGTPPGIEPDAVLEAMEAVDGVESVHHLHVWQISEQVTSLEAHLVTPATSLPEITRIKSAIRAMLSDQFGIGHVTLDTETPDLACDHPSRIGG
ncbi:cation diffusion facilitator family transporter [Maritimibacter sp. UBA3975]|uniref:cation diffusion facilitator family transporter n=1 Tax=Maritimibacter sp. UBA3975 TaxID=1946833 RepID=UPI000C0A5F97|nr:cation diffusion facilitator family transporter [Maritimibacter sp. UBA3975]MAM62056.1 cation transporter [Maritimibacter sp.]|tara:strand:+ start:16010 stop:16930 length:921 start_codon:yes stop_codon:yes gene_type:complete